MKWFVLTLKPDSLVKAPSQDLARGTESADLATAGGVGDRRFFARLGLAAVFAPDDAGPRLSTVPGVLGVFATEPVNGSVDGRWYVNVLAAFDYVIGRVDTVDAISVNVSLGLKRDPNVFDAGEPVNRATRVAADNGIVTVVAAGNRGGEGNNTMTPWSMADWVVSVGAYDERSDEVQSYSSRGIPGHATIHPTVVAADTQDPPTGEIGTSFAAPRITDVALLLQAFLLYAWAQAGLPVAQLRPFFPSIVKRSLRQMARSLSAKPHECGSGLVSFDLAVEFIQRLAPDVFVSLMPQATAHFPAIDWQKALIATQSRLTDPAELITTQRLARVTVDTTYEWTRPAFVPGLLRYKGFFIMRPVHRFEDHGDFESATTRFGQADFIELSILPHRQVARRLVVDAAGSGGFTTISAALAAARDWDVIDIQPGLYAETVTLKSGITLIGREGTVISHPSDTPIGIVDAKDVALSHLDIAAEGARREAVVIVNSRNVALSHCRLRSALGNAFGAYSSKRLMLDSCTLSGGINAVFAAFGRELRFRRSDLTGKGLALLAFDQSATVHACRLTATEGHAILFVPPAGPWTDETEILVFTPLARTVIPASEICPSNLRRDDLVGALSRTIYALEVEDSTLSGAQTGIATSNLQPLLVDGRSSVSGGWARFALVRGSYPLPVPGRPPDLSAAVRLVNDSLQKLECVPLP